MLGFKGDFHEGPPIVIHQWSKPGGSLAPRSPLAWTLLCILARNFLSSSLSEAALFLLASLLSFDALGVDDAVAVDAVASTLG